MDIYKADNPGIVIGQVRGENIYAANNPGIVIGLVRGENIYAANNPGVVIGLVRGENIYAANNPGVVIGLVRGDGTAAQKGAAGMFLMGYFDQNSGGKSEKSGLAYFIGIIIGLLIINPVGNIVFGLLFAIGLPLAFGESFDPARNPLVVANYTIGGILTAIGVFRVYRRGKKR
jgi:hypothetical protein